nr:family 16 glycosylhydrolase [Terrimesophilobacter mesophilus]
MRKLDLRRHATVFSRGHQPDALQRIYVINLDRKPDRWRWLRRELDRFYERHGERLSTIVRRFSAIDARHMESPLDLSILIPTFTLADQLTVNPNPLLKIDSETRAHKITMTRQEIAIALSHIEVWRLIADGDVPSALVLEDDVFMAPGFARELQATWSGLPQDAAKKPEFDLLYLAFKDVSDLTSPRDQKPIQRLKAGIWEASGYVLTRDGARKLLERLPAFGPIDLWLNFQFSSLKVFTAARPIIEQRIDEPSTNSYSVLPVLSQVGVITREKPLLTTARKMKGPVIAVGNRDSGLTALAKALSMLGYTCFSDHHSLPSEEMAKLLSGQRNRLFNAYVNIGSFNPKILATIAESNPGALFIVTSDSKVPSCTRSNQVLELGPTMKDKWAALSNFLEIDYPPFMYPDDADIGQRTASNKKVINTALVATDLKFDASPWILRSERGHWKGISMDVDAALDSDTAVIDWMKEGTLDDATWRVRDDTFPSNLALFTHANFSEKAGLGAVLTLREEETPVREFSSAAIASRQSYLYGSFRAELRPSNVPGLITGVFLHRNGPRQEIDIEFLGKNTTKMLVNVYYNPGPDNTKLEYGYRGTPTVIDLGFDAAADFHVYEIDWKPNAIRWKVDGTVIYERVLWDPTPIPDQPLEFNVNLWHSRSTEFAGRLARKRIPASVELRSVEIQASGSTKLKHTEIATERNAS